MLNLYDEYLYNQDLTLNLSDEYLIIKIFILSDEYLYNQDLTL